MKNKQLIRRIAGVLSAASLTFNAVAPTAVQAEQKSRSFESEPVKVIVTLYGDPILAAEGAEEGADFLDSEFARDRAIQLANNRDRVFDEILGLYPQATMDFTYDSVFNGFACTVPEELADDIEGLSGVKDAAVSTVMEIPEMNKANELTGAEGFISSTGCTGEGQVVAVIDTEIRPEHEMFAPLGDDVEYKLTKEDVARIIDERGLNCALDPDRVYYSSKLPFAANYAKIDYDPYNISSDNEGIYHGTHVAGIAAGNRVTTDEGEKLHGVAPDAQIIFISACDMEVSGLSDAAAVAGIEDAVKLGADVINMSFGKRAPNPNMDSIYDDVLENAANAGVVVCASAGNNGNPTATPDSVDKSSLNSPADRDGCISVAAAEVDVPYDIKMALKDGTPVPYRNYGEELYDSEQGYIDCGSGTVEELPEKDVMAGKIALLKLKSADDLADIRDEIKYRWANGFLIYVEGDEFPDYDKYKNPYEMRLFIDRETYEMLKAREDKTLEFTSVLSSIPDKVDAKIADYSSKGTRQDLTLKPEITAPGENILSAAYDGYSYMGGTSMASPYIAGCCAVVNEYLEKTGAARKGCDKAAQIRDLLMTLADPLLADPFGEEMALSPRRQGAGLVNMGKLEEAKVIMQGTGKAAAELGDKLESTFSFDVTLDNFSGEDVKFTDAMLELSTDKPIIESEDEVVIEGNKPVRCEITYPAEMLFVPAGEKVSFTVNVTLNAEDVAANDATFTNGWFVEGFFYLSGAENCCDISMPVLGFRGDWTQTPIIGKDDIEAHRAPGYSTYPCTDIDGAMFPASLSLSQFYQANKLLYREDSSGDEYLEASFKAINHEYFISPNFDGFADILGYTFTTERDCHIPKIEVFDEKGEPVPGASTVEADINARDKNGVRIYLENGIAEGKYTGRIQAHIFAPGAEEKMQVKEFKFNVDLTAPKLKDVTLTEKDGRKLLTIKAQDANPEGFYIIGNGKGSEAGKEPADYCNTTIFNDLLIMNNDDYELQGDYEDSLNSAPATHSTDLLSYIRDMKWYSNYGAYNFLDAIPAVPDEEGNYTLTYDVTDLTEYSITVADRAYNTVCYAPDQPLIGAVPTTIEETVGTPLKVPEAPEVTYEGSGEISWQGWEIFNPEEDWWETLDDIGNVDYSMHNRVIAYAVEFEDEAKGFYSSFMSSPVQINVKGIYPLTVEEYIPGEYGEERLMLTTLIYPGKYYPCNLDESYTSTFRLTAEGKVPRTIKARFSEECYWIDAYLYEYGDTNGDGVINVTDISKAAAHVKGIKGLSDYEQAVADVSKDGTLNVTDVSKLAAKVKGIKNF